MGRTITYKVFHLFAGIGGGALGFRQAQATLGGLTGRFRNIGAVDVDPLAVEDYTYLTGDPATVLDLFTREDYEAFHGRPPPEGWREATPADLRAAANGEAPDVVFLSPPCKGVSSLLPGKLARSAKYQALNRLVTRGLFLLMAAFEDTPPKLIILENVPRIMQRGNGLIERNAQLLGAHGFATQHTVHNAGDVGGLAANRNRYLFVARHTDQVQPFLYEPPSKGLRPLGEVLLSLPLPFDPASGPMHTLSTKMKFLTWLRLALIPAGGDWKDLLRWAPESFAVDRTPFNNVWRVLDLNESAPTITGGGTPTAGGYSVPDPRLTASTVRHSTKFQVADPAEPARTVTGTMDIQAGAMSVADPRLAPDPNRHTAKFQVADPAKPTRTVTGARLGSGTISTPDPRLYYPHPDKTVTLRVRGVDEPAPTVAGRSGIWDSAGFAATDPRPTATYRNGTLGVGDLDAPGQTVVAAADPWSTGANAMPDPRPTASYYTGTWGVGDPDEPSCTVTGRAQPSTGAFSVPDPRVALGADGRPLHWPDSIPIIISPHDGCMHRPLTTLELAALQGFPTTVRGEPLVLAAKKPSRPSVARWRNAIGNAVPPPAAKAIAETMLRTLLANESGLHLLELEPVWVRPSDGPEWIDATAIDALRRAGFATAPEAAR